MQHSERMPASSQLHLNLGGKYAWLCAGLGPILTSKIFYSSGAFVSAQLVISNLSAISMNKTLQKFRENDQEFHKQNISIIHQITSDHRVKDFACLYNSLPS